MEECIKQLLILIEDKQNELRQKLVDEQDANHRERTLMFKDFLHEFYNNAKSALHLVVLFSLIEKCHEN